MSSDQFLSVETAPATRKADAPPIVALDTQPSIQLIVSDGQQVVGGWGGESRALAQIVEVLAGLEEAPVEKVASDFLTAGQTCYTIKADALFGLRLALTFIPWNTWDTQEKFNSRIPAGVIITFIVSY